MVVGRNSESPDSVRPSAVVMGLSVDKIMSLPVKMPARLKGFTAEVAEERREIKRGRRTNRSPTHLRPISLKTTSSSFLVRGILVSLSASPAVNSLRSKAERQFAIMRPP